MQTVEIRVRGQIDRGWSERLGGLTVSHTPQGGTILAGDIRDQAELRGILCQLSDLGLELTSLTTRPEIALQFMRKGGG